jgi:hypothetical protein
VTYQVPGFEDVMVNDEEFGGSSTDQELCYRRTKSAGAYLL